MKHSRKRRMATIGSIVLISLITIVAWQVYFNRGNWPTQFQNNGERIYFTGLSATGAAMSSRGGGMHMRMMAGGCVTCHGADRQGGRLMPRFWLVAPPLTPDALFREHDEAGANDGHGDHDGYTDETLGRAITRGIDPDGKPLDLAMPRWSISDQDLDDLIAYLRSTGGP